MNANDRKALRALLGESEDDDAASGAGSAGDPGHAAPGAGAPAAPGGSASGSASGGGAGDADDGADLSPKELTKRAFEQVKHALEQIPATVAAAVGVAAKPEVKPERPPAVLNRLGRAFGWGGPDD